MSESAAGAGGASGGASQVPSGGNSAVAATGSGHGPGHTGGTTPPVIKPTGMARESAPESQGSKPRLPGEVSAGKTPEQTAEQKKEAAAEARKWKVKDGEEELEVDESELVRGYQRAKAANKRFEEASRLHKQAEEFIGTLRKDPMRVLMNPNLGINFREIAEAHLAEEIRRKTMTPEEIEAEARNAELEQYRSEKAQAKKKEDEIRFEELKRNEAAKYRHTFMEALTKGGLPPTEFTLRRMATYANEARKRKVDLSSADLAQMVKEDYISEAKTLFGNLDGDGLLSLLGEEIAGKIRKADLSRIKDPLQQVEQQQQRERTQRQDSPTKRLTRDEARELAMKRIGAA